MESKLNKIILAATSLGAFIVPFMTSSINIALPSISEEFALNSVILSWITLSFTLSVAVFVMPFGRLADMLGRKKILLIGMTVFVLSTMLCGFSFNSVILILGRCIQGASGAAITVTVVSILTSVFPPGARGKALGLNVAMTYAGLSTGPYLGGVLTKYLGWRSIFFISACAGLIVIIALLHFKQDWTEAKGEKFDYAGSVIYAIALLGIIIGFSVIHSIWGPVLIAIGIIAIVIFVFYESKSESPILNMSLFRKNRVVAFSSLAALINYSATFALSYLLSLYLQYNKGFEPSHAGLIMMAQPVVMALFSPAAGFLSDKLEPRKVASLGMALTTIGLSFFIFFNEKTGLSYIICALLILGFGFALFSSPNTNAVMCSVEKKYYGMTSGILGAARTVGQTFSMGIASAVVVIYVGNAKISSENSLDLLMAIKTTFTILTILCFAGIFASFARGKVKKE